MWLIAALMEQTEPAITNPRIVCHRWPSNYDAKSWAADVIRVENAKTDEEKTIAIYKWVRLLQHWGNQCGDGTRGKHVIECDAIKKLNIFPFGECSDFGVTSAALGHAGGLKAMEAHVPGHCQLEVSYMDSDGVERWHRLDPFWGIVVYDKTGRHIASNEDIREDRDVALKPSKVVAPWGDKESDRSRFADKGECKASRRVRPSAYTMDKSLVPGETYELRWEREKIAFYNSHPNSEYRVDQNQGGFQRFQYANGQPENLKYGHEALRPHLEVGKWGVQVGIGHGRLTFAPPLDRNFEAPLHEPARNVVADPKLRPSKAGEPAVLVYAVRSPYVIVHAELSAKFRAGKDDSVKFSIALADWRQREYTLDQVLPSKPEWTTTLESPGTVELDALRGEYQYLLKVEMMAAKDPKTVGIDELSVAHLFQENMLALPRLMPGKNVITVTARAIRTEYQLEVTYVWDDARGKDRRDRKLVDRVPFSYEIVAAGDQPADVRTRSVRLEPVRKSP